MGIAPSGAIATDIKAPVFVNGAFQYAFVLLCESRVEARLLHISKYRSPDLPCSPVTLAEEALCHVQNQRCLRLARRLLLSTCLMSCPGGASPCSRLRISAVCCSCLSAGTALMSSMFNSSWPGLATITPANP